MNTPDGGVTDEPMPLEWMQAYADAYPDRVPAYVAENGAPNLRKVQDDAQPGVSPMVHTAPSQSADLIAEAEAIAERLTTSLDATKALRDLITALRAAEAENARWKRRVEIQRDLIIRHEQTIERFLEALMFIKSGDCLLYTSPSPRDGLLSRMPSSA